MEKRNSDEIDLYNLLVKTIFFFRANLLLFLLFTVTGIVVSVVGLRYLRTQSAPTYTVKILVHSKAASLTVGSALLNTLNSYLTTGDLSGLGRDLALTPDEAAAIGSFRTEGIRNERPASRDSIYNIVIQIRNNTVAPKVIDGVIKFIESNPFVKHQTQLRHATEVAKGITPPENDKGIEVISSFTTNSKQSVHSILSLILMGIAGGIFAAFVFIALRGIVRIAKS